MNDLVENIWEDTWFLKQLRLSIIDYKISCSITNRFQNNSNPMWIGFKKMWLQLVEDLNWTLHDLNMIINKIPTFTNRNIIDQLEKSVSLIIAFKLNMASHSGGPSLNHIIEYCDIMNWYDNIYNIAISTGFPDDMERQKQDLINELLKTNKGNPRIMSYVHENLLLTLNKIENILEVGHSGIINSRNIIKYWNKDDIKLWSDKCKKLGSQKVIENIEEVIAVICAAVSLWFGYYPRHSKSSLC